MPGSYYLEFRVAEGIAFSPAGDAAAVAPQLGRTPVFTLSVNQSATHNVGLVYTPGSIEGEVFHDVDGDGIRDAGETALSGWSVRLLNEHSQLIGTRTTAGDGHYAFVDLPPGDYRVEQVMTPTGWRQSSPGGPVIGGLDITSGGALSPEDGQALAALREALRTTCQARRSSHRRC